MLYKQTKFRGAYGFIGATVGVDVIVSDKVTVGAQAFTNYINYAYGLSANYHFQSVLSKGWFFGIDVFSYGSPSDPEGELDLDKLGGFISVGYRATPWN